MIALRRRSGAPAGVDRGGDDTLIEACERLRDRFLLTLLRGTGLRIGEALGLRHEDIDARRGLSWSGRGEREPGSGQDVVA